MSTGAFKLTDIDPGSQVQHAGQYTAADLEPDHTQPESFWRTVYDRSGLGAIQKLSASLADWAEEKTKGKETEHLTEVAKGQNPQSYSSSEMSGANYDLLARGARLVSGAFSPKSVALTAGVAAANTNPVTGVPVDAALIAHGGYGVVKNAPKALEGNPEAAQDALLSGAEMAGGGAGAAGFRTPELTPTARLSQQIAHARAMDATVGTPARAIAAQEAAAPVAQAVAPVNPKNFVGGAAVKAAAESVSPIEPFSALTKAIKPGTNMSGWSGALKTAAPDLLKQDAVKPITDLNSMLSAIGQAKKAVWADYQKILGPNADATIDGSSVADAMKNSIDARYRMQHPEQAASLDKVAETYNRPLTLSETEDFLQSANNDLHSYYAKNKVGQSVAKGDPSIANVVAEADALRDALYGKLDELSGPGARELKQRYGALSQLEEPVLKRKNVFERQQPDSLQEQLNIAQGAAKVGARAVTGNLGDALYGAGQIAVSKFLKQRGDSNWLVKHAFDQLRNPQAAKPATMPLPSGSFPPSAIFSSSRPREDENQ